MKTVWMMLALVLMACSAPMPGDEVAKEDVGEQQDALGTCPRPTGGGGDTTGTVDGYVSSIQADATQPWRFKVYYRQTGSMLATLRYVNFGGVSVANSHANITGPGWTSASGSKLLDGYLTDHNSSFGISAGCTNNANLKCLIATEDMTTYFPVLYFDKSYCSSPAGTTHLGFANGLTAIIGMGATLPQKMRFYFDVGSSPSSIGSVTTTFSGPMLDACATP